MDKPTKAGRELDEAVAVIMGWKLGAPGTQMEHYCQPAPYKFGVVLRENIPHYSTDIAAAWLVVDKMAKDGWHIKIGLTGEKWDVEFWGHGKAVHEYALTAPIAVCVAALKAAGGVKK